MDQSVSMPFPITYQFFDNDLHDMIIHDACDAHPSRRQEASASAAKIAVLEEAQLAAEGKYSSLAEEAEKKTQKLQKLWRKFQVRGGHLPACLPECMSACLPAFALYL